MREREREREREPAGCINNPESLITHRATTTTLAGSQFRDKSIHLELTDPVHGI